MTDAGIRFGEDAVEAAYIVSEPVRDIFFQGAKANIVDVVSDFLSVAIDPLLAANYSSPSSGNSRMVAVSDGNGGRFYARVAADEVVVRGAQRRQSLLTDLNIAGYNKIKSGAEASVPMVTPNFYMDPRYGACARVQLDAGASGSSGNYSWLYKLLTASDTQRRNVSVQTPIRLTAAYRHQDQFNGDGVTKVFTLSAFFLDARYFVFKVNGVIQRLGGIDCTVSGKTLTFVTAPPVGVRNVTVDISAKTIGLTRGLGTQAAKNVGIGWSTIQSFFPIAAGAGADYGFGLHVNRGGTLDAAIDVLIPMNALSSPVVEVVSDTLLPRPAISAGQSYGWGANGVLLEVPSKQYPPSFSFAGVTRFDDFHRADTAVGTLSASPQGNAYEMWASYLLTPATSGQIKSNKFTASSPSVTTADYAMETVPGRVTRFGSIVQYDTNAVNIGPTGFTWAMLMCMTRNRFTDHMIHFIGTHIGWVFEVWLPDGSTVVLASGSFRSRLWALGSAGGQYPIEFSLNGDTATILVPGDKIVVKSDLLTPFAGARYLAREHFVGGPSQNILNFIAAYSTVVGETPVSAGLYQSYTPFIQVPQFRPAPSKTENVTYSTTFTNAAWTKAGIGTPIALTAATQKLEAQQVWKLPEDTSTGLHVISQATGLGAVQQTVTAIVASAERTFAYVDLYNATDGVVANAIVNLATGAVTSGAAVVDIQLQSGVFEVHVTGTPTVTGSVVRVGPALNGTASSYTGTAGSGIACYYAGAEAGPKFTGPIATAGAALTRAADQPNTGAILTSTDWTLFAQIRTPAGTLADQRVLSTAVASAVKIMADGRVRVDNGTTQLDTAAGVVAAGSPYGIVVRKSGASTAIFVGGVKLIDTAFDPGIAPSDTLDILADAAGSGQGNILGSRIRVKNYAESDAYCAGLSSL